MLETIQRMVGLDGMYLPDFSYAPFALKLLFVSSSAPFSPGQKTVAGLIAINTIVLALFAAPGRLGGLFQNIFTHYPPYAN
jgi:hypothetical protein